MKHLTLYLLTHNKTGLKYFGKTIKDLNFYFGSGTAWNLHCEKYGWDIKKEIILKIENTSENQELIRTTAMNYSIKNDIVQNDDYANLINESGVSGFVDVDKDIMNTKITDKLKNKTFKKRFDIQPNSLKMLDKQEIVKIKSTLSRGPGTKITPDGIVVIRYDNANRVNDVYKNLKWDLFRNAKAIKPGVSVVLIPINGLKEVGVMFEASSEVYDINTNIEWSKL